MHVAHLAQHYNNNNKHCNANRNYNDNRHGCCRGHGEARKSEKRRNTTSDSRDDDGGVARAPGNGTGNSKNSKGIIIRVSISLCGRERLIERMKTKSVQILHRIPLLVGETAELFLCEELGKVGDDG